MRLPVPLLPFKIGEVYYSRRRISTTIKLNPRIFGIDRDNVATWEAEEDKVMVDEDGKKHRESQHFRKYEDQVSLDTLKIELVTSPSKACAYATACAFITFQDRGGLP